MGWVNAFKIPKYVRQSVKAAKRCYVAFERISSSFRVFWDSETDHTAFKNRNTELRGRDNDVVAVRSFNSPSIAVGNEGSRVKKPELA